MQGIAVDSKRGYAYFSFTNLFVKTRLDGTPVGTVSGLAGHLGCIALHPEDGRVYASLEYKRDAIGEGIRKTLGLSQEELPEDGFYIAIFDTEKIDRPNMNAETDSVVRCVHLQEVLTDYAAKDPLHRYGCSGIDGLSFGPEFGAGPDGPRGLCVAYGVYRDVERTDNDHQVILRYDTAAWDQYAAPLNQRAPHRQGPPTPNAKYFVFTGNTTYGIQNLEYDAYTGNWLAAVYIGTKSCYPNNSLYIIDGSRAPEMGLLPGCGGEEGLRLSLWERGLRHEPSGVYGWESEYGATGMFSLGDGRFYLSHPHRDEAGFSSEVCLYRWTGKTPCPFERID